LQAAETDTELQQVLYTACSQSILYWINTFMFTYRLFLTGSNGVTRQCTSEEAHTPFVTWDIQNKHILRIEQAITKGFELLTDKSRDMGATWDHIATIHHQWLFRSDRSFLEISRKEDCVDTIGKTGEVSSDPGTLFGKHDYINRWLPKWMLPPYDRKRLHLINLLNQSRIDGESSNAAAGSSDRRTAIMLDEMALMAEGEGIKRSTRDVTACRLPNSTPAGPGTAYSKWRQSGQIEVFVLPWWEHPEKGFKRYVMQKDVVNEWLIRSPWYHVEEKKRTPKEMAINIDMDHIGSGETFFEAYNIERHRHLYARPSLSRWTVDFRPEVTTGAIPRILAKSQRSFVQAQLNTKGPWHIWCKLVNGRLDQSKNYIFGIDISKGQGASNSIITIMCVETREIVAEFVDANTPPYELARIACAAALWVGGARRNGRVFMIWEANGPGWDFGRQVVHIYKYPFYFVDHSTGVVTEKKGKKYGWHSSREKKGEALGMLRRAFAHGGILTHDEQCLEEALSYIHYDGGGIGPAELMVESAEARKCHGDRVIGHMLCLYAVGEVPKAKLEKPKAPHRSMAYRREQVMKKLRQEKRNRRLKKSFNFKTGDY